MSTPSHNSTYADGSHMHMHACGASSKVAKSGGLINLQVDNLNGVAS